MTALAFLSGDVTKLFTSLSGVQSAGTAIWQRFLVSFTTCQPAGTVCAEAAPAASIAVQEIRTIQVMGGIISHHSSTGRGFVDRIGGGLNGTRAALFQIEDDDLVRAWLEPWRRHEEALLRADAPVAAQVLTVDPDDAFAPSAHIQEGVAGCRQAERTAVQRGPGGGLRRERPAGGIGDGQRIDFPGRELVAIQRDFFGDAFAVGDELRAEVDAAHVFDQDVEGYAGVQLHVEFGLAQAAVEHAEALFALADDGIIAGLGDRSEEHTSE